MDSFFADEPSEHAYIKNNSKSRDRALYSYDEGPPTIPRDNLRENALHYAKVTVGMIVFATEVHRGFVSPPLVQQLAADAGWLIERLRPQSKTRPASGGT